MPVLKWNNAGTWTDLPLIGQPGPPGADGAQGPAGPPGIATTDHLVARAGDAMTGALTQSIGLDGSSPSRMAATKRYVDSGGNQGSSFVGYYNDVSTSYVYANQEASTTFFRPVPMISSGLTVQDLPGLYGTPVPSIVVDRTGYYLIYFLVRISPPVTLAGHPVPGQAASTIEIGGQTNWARGMATMGYGEDFCAVTANIWFAAGQYMWFYYENNTGNNYTAMRHDPNFIVHYMGDSQ